MIENEKLIELKLSPSNYVILDLIFQKKYNCLKGFFDANLIDESNFIDLEKMGWIKLLDAFNETISFESIGIREKTTKLFKSDLNTKFLTLWVMYPMKVGDRILKPANSDTKEGQVCFEKWKKIVEGKPLLPDVMIKCLEKQLKIERHKLQYLQQFKVWLNQQTWERYIDLKETTDDKIEGI